MCTSSQCAQSGVRLMWCVHKPINTPCFGSKQFNESEQLNPWLFVYFIKDHCEGVVISIEGF